MSSSAQFIVNDEGERKVILPAGEYEQLLEDVADLGDRRAIGRAGIIL